MSIYIHTRNREHLRVMVLIGVSQFVFWSVAFLVYLGFYKYYQYGVQPVDKYIDYCALSSVVAIGLMLMLAQTMGTDWFFDFYGEQKGGFSLCLTYFLPIIVYIVFSRDLSLSRTLLLFLVCFETIGFFLFYSLFYCKLELLVASRKSGRLLVFYYTKTPPIVFFFNRLKKSNLLIDEIECAPASFSMCLLVLKLNERLKSVIGKIDSVVLCNIEIDSQVMADVVTYCDSVGVRIYLVNDLKNKLGRKIFRHSNGQVEIISFRHEPLELFYNKMMKRCLDIAISIPVCLFLMPVLIIIVLFFQLWQAPGPIFYVQKRNGLNRKQFNIIKFRSMYSNNLNQGLQAKRGDVRIYAFGAFMRKTSIDEVPQFINVLLGQMSVVGPRPHLAQHDDEWKKVEALYSIRSYVKPGITGLAQVRGFRGEVQSEVCIKNRVQSDIEYLENWELLSDLRIILVTVTQMVSPLKTAV